MSYHFDTQCVHGTPDRAYEDGIRSLSFPIYQSAAFAHTEIGHGQFNYTRQDNPTRLRLEETVAALEGGADAIAFTSGMAAIAAAVELLRPGDQLICSEDLYGGTTRLFQNVTGKNGVDVVFVDTTDMAKVRAAVTPRTRMLYIETPSNPMMNVTDIRACAEAAHENGALLAVDNTFLSPVFQRPIALGADLVIHSGTKYLAGHNDTISGFVITAEKALGERLHLMGKTTGALQQPFDAWLVLRGIKTLSLRMHRIAESAGILAERLKAMPHVTQVYYAGLPEHPGHALNCRQATGAGGMLSFRVDRADRAVRVLKAVKLITFAESLGGTETLITYPMTQTHDVVPEEMRVRLGIDGTLLRLSVGIEDVEDLLADLKQALEG